MGRRFQWVLRGAGVTALFLVLAALVYLHTSAFRGMLERQVASTIEDQLGRECRLRLVGLRPLALAAEVEDLRIAGAGPEEPAFVELDSASIDARLGLLLRGRLDLSSVVASGLRIEMNQLPTLREDDTATPTTFGDLNRLLAIDRLTLSDSAVRWGDETRSLSLDASGLSLSVSGGKRVSEHSLRLEIAEGTLDVPAIGAALPFSSAGELRLGDAGLRLDRFDLTGAGIDVRATGALTDLVDFSGSAEARIEARTGTVLEEVRGEATLDASSRFSAGDFEITATLTSRRLAWREWPAEDVRLELRGVGDGWRSKISASVHGVQVRGEVEGAALDRLAPLSARVEFESGEVERLLSALGAFEAPVISGPVAGRIDVRAEALDLESMRGTFALESSELRYERLPRSELASVLNGSIEEGRVTFEQFRASGPGLTLEGHGFTELGGETDLHVEIDARSMTLAGPRGLPLDLRAAVGLRAGRVVVEELSVRGRGVEADGSGRFATDGTLDAKLDVRVSELGEVARAVFEELGALGVDPSIAGEMAHVVGTLRLSADVSGKWDRLDGTLHFSGEQLGTNEVPERRALRGEGVLRDGGGEFRARLEGDRSHFFVQSDLNSYLRPSQGAIGVELVEDSPAWWAAVTGMTVPGQGTVEVDAHYDVATGTLRDARLRLPGGLVTFDGGLGLPDGRAELHVRTRGFDLGESVRSLGGTLPVQGRIDVDTVLAGRLDDPSVSGTVSLAELSLSDRRLPPLSGGVSYRSHALEIDLAEPGGESELTARANFDDSTSWSLGVRYPLRLDVNELTRSSPDGSPLELEALIRADLTGNALALDGVEGQIELHGARLRVGDDSLVSQEGFRFEIAGGRARLTPFRIEAGGLVLRGEGELPFDPEEPLRARVTGELPLELLSGRLPGLKLGGVGELDIRVGGRSASPVWDGVVRLENGRLSYPGLPAPLENAEATLALAADRWAIDTLSAGFGGGRIRGRGHYIPIGEGAGRIMLSLKGEAIRAPLVEGLQSEFDGDVVLEGELDRTLDLSGSVRFARAAYGREIDLGTQMLTRARNVTVGTEVGGLLDKIRLDLEAVAPGSLWVRNNLASIETAANLRIRGTAAAPIVTGEVELEEGGRVFFRQVTYYVTRGTLSYVSDPPENPRVDIEAQTTVSKYDVTLLVSGRLADLEVDLLSDPPLPQADIVSLLVVGRTRDELGQGTGGLAESQAAQYLGSGLTRETERLLKRSLGLDQVRIDPVLVAGETDPTARLTVGKTLTAKTSTTYSRSLDGTQADIYELRYEPTRGLTIVAARDEDGENAVDAVQTKRFFSGPSAPRSVSDSGQTEQRIVRWTIEGAGEIGEKRLRSRMNTRKGVRYRESALLAALDVARDVSMEAGYPEARVDAQVAEEGDGVGITVRIVPGRRVSVDIEGIKNVKEIRETILTLWQRTIFLEGIADEAADTIRQELRDRGFLEAEVRCELVRADREEATLAVVVRKGPRVRVDRLVIDGNRQIPEEQIRAELLTQESGWLLPRWLSATTVEEDREAVRALYVGRGFLDVAIDPVEISYPEEVTRGVVTISIAEGSRYRVGAVEFADNEAFDDETLTGVTGLMPGSPYLDEDLRAARARLRAFYDSRGYPEIRIEVRTTVRRQDGRVDTSFNLTEGPHKLVESVEVVGARQTRERVITRELELAASDPLSADKVAATRQKLYRTGLFRAVTVVEEPGQSEKGRRLTFQVEERPDVQLDYGLGVATDDGVRGSARASHSNLGGRRLYGSLGGRASRNDWRLSALLRQPNLFGSSLQGVGSFFRENERQESFDVRRTGAKLEIDSDPGDRRIRWFAGYGLESVDILREGVSVVDGSGLPPEVGGLIDRRQESALRLGNGFAGFVAGRVDDFTWPTRGNLLQAKFAAYAPVFLSEADFLRGFVQWSVHRPLGNRRVVWNSGLRLGVMETFGGTSQVPLSERFFAGGDNSLRGFERDSLEAVGFPGTELSAHGVTVEDSLGGNVLLIANQELLAMVRDPVAVALFYDAGNLYWQLDDLDPADLRHTAGLGLRVKTPAGALRLEYGWKLDRKRDESRGRVHFSIGFPF